MTYEDIVSLLGYAGGHEQVVRITTSARTEVVGIPGYELDASRCWISSSLAPSGGNGTKKWPSIRSENAGGLM